MDRSTARLTGYYLSLGLPFLYFLTSIAFYLHTYDSAQIKITLVQMLGIFLMGFWYLKLTCEGGVALKKYRTVAVPLVASLASGLLSFSHAAYRGPSLDECLRRVFYIHFALIALTEINTRQRMKQMMTWLLAATAISVGYGVLEMLDIRFYPAGSFSSGLNPFIWRQAFGTRIFSTFGNPNFYGNFLVIVTPITLALLLKRHRQKPIAALAFALAAIAVSAMIWQADLIARLAHLESWNNALFLMVLGGFLFWSAFQFSFLGILFFLITLCNMETYSKGAWVGYAAGFVSFLILVLFYFSQFHSERLRRIVKAGAVMTLVIFALGVGAYSLQRVDSLRFRVCTWVSTWEMALTHPLLGNGIGSFRVIYPAYRRPQIFHIEAKHNTETDHAEDEYWEVFQDEGLVGFGIFIWAIATFSILGLRALGRFTTGASVKDSVTGKRKQIDDPRAYYMLGVIAAFWGMLIHNGMDVSIRFVSSGIFLWLLAGLIGAMVVHDPMFESDDQRYAMLDAEGRAGDARPVPALLCSGMQMITWALFAWVAYVVFKGFSEAQGNFPDPFGEQAQWLISWVAMAATAAACLWGIWKVSRSLRRPYAMVVLWATIYPLYTFWGYFMADVYHNRGIFFSKQTQWQAALESYEKVIRLNPNYLMAYYFMGNVYTDRWAAGDFERAMEAYRRLWAIAPNYVQSHHQAGLICLKKGTEDRQALDRARASGHQGEASRLLQQTEQDFTQAMRYFQKYHAIDPVYEPNYARMAYADGQLADLARFRGQSALAEQFLDQGEAFYKESLDARECRKPYHDVLREHWGHPPYLSNSWENRSWNSERWGWCPRLLREDLEYYGGNLFYAWRSQWHDHFNAETFSGLGNLRFMRGRLQDAAKAYRLAVWQDPRHLQAWKNLAACYARLGDQARVLKTWQHIREMVPQDPDVQRVFRQHP